MNSLRTPDDDFKMMFYLSMDKQDDSIFGSILKSLCSVSILMDVAYAEVV